MKTSKGQMVKYEPVVLRDLPRSKRYVTRRVQRIRDARWKTKAAAPFPEGFDETLKVPTRRERGVDRRGVVLQAKDDAAWERFGKEELGRDDP